MHVLCVLLILYCSYRIVGSLVAYGLFVHGAIKRETRNIVLRVSVLIDATISKHTNICIYIHIYAAYLLLHIYVILYTTHL